MNSARRPYLTLALLLFLVLPTASLAQDDTESEEERQPGFWGDFALFIEAAYGQSALDDIDSSVDLKVVGGEPLQDSRNTLSFDDFDSHRFAIGWTLPFDRGSFRLEFEGFKENGYALDAIGRQNQFVQFDDVNGNGILDVDEDGDPVEAVSINQLGGLAQWWTTRIEDGRLVSTRSAPLWAPTTLDADGDAETDVEELVYGTPDVQITQNVIDSLQNSFQTWDILYGRDFGGRRVGAEWTAGIRHFSYEGNILSPLWVGSSQGSSGGFAYTAGGLLAPVVFNQKSTGTGPTGSMAVVVRLFRERLELAWTGRIAFVFQSLETDTGPIITVPVVPGDEVTTRTTRLANDLSKDAWHVSGQFESRFRLVGGLSAYAQYYVTAYQDAIVRATTTNVSTVPQTTIGTTAQYNTNDLRLDGWRFGLRFQF